MKRILITISLALVASASLPANVIISPARLSEFRNDMIASIYQDEYDAIWFNANGFIYRYNGQNSQLVAGPVKSGRLYGNGQGSVFAVSYVSITEFDTRSFKQTVHKPGIEDYRRPSLLSEGDSLWISSGSGLFLYQSGITTRVCDTGSEISCLIRLNNGKLVAGTFDGKVLELSGDGADVIYESGDEEVTDLIQDEDGKLWLASGTDVICTDTGQTVSLEGSVRVLIQYSGNELLAGCTKGLYRIDMSGTPELIDLGSHNETPVTSLLMDRNSGVWIGTYYDGILHLESTGVDIENIPGHFKYVKALVGREVDFWALTDGNGLFRIQDGNVQLVDGSKGIKFQCGCLYDEKLYCGVHFDGIHVYDAAAREFHRIGFGDRSRTIFSIERRGDDLILGTNEGVFLFNPKKEDTIQRKVPGMNNYCYSTVYDPANDRLWIGSNGLYFKDGDNEVEKYTSDIDNPLSGKKCSSLSICRDGSLLFATSGAGIYKIKGDSEESYCKQNVSLPTDVISQCIEVNDSLILAGYSDGLVLLDIESKSCNRFSGADESPISSMRGGCLARLGEESIYAGGKDGIMTVRPGPRPFSSGEVLFSIDRLYVNNEPYTIPLSGSLDLKHNENNLIFEIADFSYSNIPSSIIEYRMEGFDGQWRQLPENRMITYMNIRPGNYTLQVRGAASASCSFITRSLNFRIRPVWYASIAAIIAWILLSLAVIGWVLYILYTRVILRERLNNQEKINAERNRMFIDISHQLRTPLTMILGQMELFFSKNKEKFQGRGHIESSYANAKEMRKIISEFVDFENTADDEGDELATYNELNITGLYVNRTRMLIVDDNREIRLLLNSIFNGEYQIIEARNGEEGLALAKKEQPDIIISDVMMPEMDGLEMTAKLKSDFETSHIPIILLTAHASEKHNLQGLNLGADDYITKPFSNEILKARCRGLLRNREIMKEKMRTLTAGDRDESSANSIFINRVLGAIEKHLPKPDVPTICKELGMSRTSLTTKIKEATDMTPREYIEDIKLKIATNLIMEGCYNISEISDKLGYSNPKYFTTRFTRRYGVAPSRYRK